MSAECVTKAYVRRADEQVRGRDADSGPDLPKSLN